MTSIAFDVRSHWQRMQGNLWHDQAFRRLWAGQTVSLFGSQIGALALPLLAVLVLNATPLEVALLSTATWTPYLLVSLFAGLWVDRHRRRPILIAADLGRAALLLVVPLLHWLGILRIEVLYAVAFLVGILSVFFSLAYGSYLPTIVPYEHLVEGNTKLQASASVAEIGGPSLGGVIVQLLTAPVAIVLDASSFLVSAFHIWRIPDAEPAPQPERAHHGVVREIGDGLRTTFANPYLRAVCGEAATYNLFEQVILALWVVYATYELRMAPALIGEVVATGAVGALVGSVAATSVAQRVGFGPALIGSMVVCCTALSLLPLASGPRVLVVALLAVGFFLNGIGLGMSNVYVRSLLQAVTPSSHMGRVLASYSFFNTGAVPIGAFVGGVLQTVIGLRLTLVVGALGVLIGLLWVVLSGDVRSLRQLPTTPPREEGTPA